MQINYDIVAGVAIFLLTVITVWGLKTTMLPCKDNKCE